jgi:hypothetical protein
LDFGFSDTQRPLLLRCSLLVARASNYASFVIPAQAGIHFFILPQGARRKYLALRFTQGFLYSNKIFAASFPPDINSYKPIATLLFL